MQYIRFWIRTCIVFCPLLFVILYFGAHVSFVKSLLSTLLTGASGIVLMAPVALLVAKVDRTMWSEYEYQQRLERKRRRYAHMRQTDDELPESPGM